MDSPIPKRCKMFGRPHQWSGFVYIEGRYVCGECGVEDDEQWWDEDGTTYIGPSELTYNALEDGYLLRRAV